MATTKNSEKKVTKMSRSQLNEMINYQIDQKVINYIVESQGITLNKACKQLNESAKDGFVALKQGCKNQAVRQCINLAIINLSCLKGKIQTLANEDLDQIIEVLSMLIGNQNNSQQSQQNIDQAKRIVKEMLISHKVRRSELNEVFNLLNSRSINEGIKDTFKNLANEIRNNTKTFSVKVGNKVKNTTIKAQIILAIKALQGAVKLLDGEAKTDMQSMVNVLMALTADQTGNQVHAYGNGVQNQPQGQ